MLPSLPSGTKLSASSGLFSKGLIFNIFVPIKCDIFLEFNQFDAKRLG